MLKNLPLRTPPAWAGGAAIGKVGMILINGYDGVPVRMAVYPGSLVQLHVDTAVAAIAREGLVTARIVVRELRAWTIIDSPRGVVYEETTPVIKNRVVDVRWWIPEGRAYGIGRFELVR